MRSVALLVVLVFVNAPPTAAQPAKRQDGKSSVKVEPRTPLDHLRAARAALDEIASDDLHAGAAEKLNDVKSRLATLEDRYLSHGKKTMSTEQTPSGSTRVRIGHQGTWTSQVPEIDKLLGQVLQRPGALARSEKKDAEIRRKVTAVRTHLTAFAAGAGGTSAPSRQRL
jgi:hypothetical protein